LCGFIGNVEFLETKPDTIANNDAEIDTLIYALYAMSEDEIKIVEGK